MSRPTERIITRKIDADDVASITAAVDAVYALDGEWEMLLTPADDEHGLTARQRKYFHMCCGLFAKYLSGRDIGNGVTAFTTEKVKRDIAEAVFGTRDVVNLATGEKRQEPNCLSTERLRRWEYSKLIDTLIDTALHYGCKLPEPARFYDVDAARAPEREAANA